MNSAALRRVEDLQRRQASELAYLDRKQGRPPSLADLRAIASLKQQNEQLFANLELQLPEQRADDSPVNYEARLLDQLKRHSPKWRSTDMLAMARANALGAVRAEIRADAQRVCDDVTVGSFKNPGALRRIEKVDAAGQKITEWAGPTWFGAAFQLPFCQNIVAFGDGKGRWFDTSGEITGKGRR
jgi:hypothetical protein